MKLATVSICLVSIFSLRIGFVSTQKPDQLALPSKFLHNTKQNTTSAPSNLSYQQDLSTENAPVVQKDFVGEVTTTATATTTTATAVTESNVSEAVDEGPSTPTSSSKEIDASATGANKTELTTLVVNTEDDLQEDTHRSINKVKPRKGAENLDLDEGEEDVLGQRKTSKISGRKGVDQDGPSLVSYTNYTPDQIDGVHNVGVSLQTTSSTTTTTFSTTRLHSAEEPHNIIVSDEDGSKEIGMKKTGTTDPTPSTSLIVGVIFGVMLFSVLGCLVYKRLDAIRRRREYRRMNDFLIDGMYNDV